MGGKFRSGDNPDQVMLMPADPREWLPAGHLAWRVLELAGEMDLSGFGGYRADGQGGRPYDPRVMATLLLYCYCRGRRSSREIEMATFDDVGARVICGGLHPDHSTVAEFVRRNAGAVLALLPELVRACAAEGLVSLDVVAGDGTKLKANAAMAGNLTREQLEAQIAELEGWIGAELRSWVRDMLDGEGITAPEAAAARCGGPGGGKGKWKSKPARAGQMLRRRLEARARLDARQGAEQDKARGGRDARVAELAARVARKEAALARWEGKAQARIDARAARAAAGQRPRGRAPLPVSADREVTRARQALADARADHAAALARAGAGERRPDGRRRPGRPAKPGGAGQAAGAGQPKVNPADPSSRVMPLKKGGYDQLFNVQALATARTQVILAVTRHDSPADVQALQPLMEQARRVLAAAGVPGQIGKALFDAGYASDANFTAGIPETLYIAVTREARQAGRSAAGRDPETMLPSWQHMKDRLATSEGRHLYKQRSATIEPVFAQLTARLGRTLRYRGTLADAELALWAASHNILKAITARARRRARTATAPGQVDPVGLAEHLAADSDYDRRLHQVRIYRGQPDGKLDPKGYAASRRQHAAWQRSGLVKLINRPLRYPYGWPEAYAPGDRPREKGIDVALAVDFALMAVRGEYEVGILMSTDTDMKPALDEVASMRRSSGPRAEVASWSAAGRHNRRLSIPSRNLYCHWVGKDVYDQIADATDYSV